jgi:hypothetical protein
VVDEPTRITADTSNILDLFFTNNISLINKVEVIPGISDHEAVYLESSLRPQNAKKPPRLVYMYGKANYEDMREELVYRENAFCERASGTSVDATWEYFKDIIHSLIQKYIPSRWRTDKKGRKPWINREVRSLITKRNTLFIKQKRTKSTEDKNKYLKAKGDAQKAIRSAHWQYIDNIIEVGDPDDLSRPNKQKRFWQYIKSIKKESGGIAALKDNGAMYKDPKDKADILNRAFKSFFTREDISNIPGLESERLPQIRDIKVSMEGVKKLLVNLDPHKASGPDLIPAKSPQRNGK